MSPGSGERKFTLPAVHDSCLQASQLGFLNPGWENSSLSSAHEQISSTSQICHARQNLCPGSITEALVNICREVLFIGRQQRVEMYPVLSPGTPRYNISLKQGCYLPMCCSLLFLHLYVAAPPTLKRCKMLDSIPKQQFKSLNCAWGKVFLLVTLLKSFGSL